VTVGCGEQATRERTLKIAIMGSGGIGGFDHELMLGGNPLLDAPIDLSQRGRGNALARRRPRRHRQRR
jgi:hypothetical protein